MRTRVPAILAMFLAAALATPSLAAWPNSPIVNVPLCTASFDQFQPKGVSDGAGGAIVTWSDYRGGLLDIYAQHVLASGAADPAWPAGGRALCTALSNQFNPMIVSDGAGGAIVTWNDSRSGLLDIYAQRVLASGAVDPAWPADGRALCTAVNNQGSPKLVSDGGAPTGGGSGAIVAWHDLRGGTSYDIYAQHALASGVADPAWPADGRLLCNSAGDQKEPTIVSDGVGGAIVAWGDMRNGADSDIYVQHVLASGAIDLAWPSGGQALSTAPGHQARPALATDGDGGAIVTWHDLRSFTSYDIYAQHVLSFGMVPAGWPLGGLALSTAANEQSDPTIASDGAGGAIVCWNDYRNGAFSDIYAQRALASGAVDPAWPANGLALCTTPSNRSNPTIVSDGGAPTGGGSGAIVAWHDFRSGWSHDIYAQRVLTSGGVDYSWPIDGRAISTAALDQSQPILVSDGAAGAIVVWQDGRKGNLDIYAQRVARYGYLGTPEAEIASVRDVPNDQGGRVKLSWNASYLEFEPFNLVQSYRVFRSVPPNLAASRVGAGARVAPVAEEHGFVERPGDLLSTVVAGTTYYWELLGTLAVDYLPNYSYVAATTSDSVGGSNPATAFMVQSRSWGSQHWESLPMSGYSVDNLGPAAPAPLTGQFAGGTTHLHWNPNAEADLAGYRLYRATSASFVPGEGNLVAAVADTGYADVAGAPYYYKLTAVDVHGNESPVATLSPSATTDVEGGVTPRALAFASPSPNPASALTTLRYALPQASHVRLAIYDAAGRLVRELTNGTQEAGEHAEAWDLRSAGGGSAGAGLYFARLEVAGRSLVQRVVVTR